MSGLILIAACGGAGKSTTPTGPTSTPAPATRIIALEGNMAFGNITVGSSSESALRIRNNGTGTLTITGLTGPSGYTTSWTSGPIAAGTFQDVTVRFSPVEEKTYNGTVTVNGDQTSGTNTMSISGTGSRPAGPRTTIPPGQFLVGSELTPGRYYAVPSSGCYFERQSGLGGSLGDIIANEFINFSAGQWIIDILASDKAFETDSDCGTWFNSPRKGSQTTISQGMWLVGTQIQPGTYRASVQSGCYWERLRNFQGTVSASVIANDFVSTPGQRLVTISASDAGFSTDDSCGTWSLVQGVSTGAPTMSQTQTLGEMEQHRARYRQEKGFPR